MPQPTTPVASFPPKEVPPSPPFLPTTLQSWSDTLSPSSIRPRATPYLSCTCGSRQHSTYAHAASFANGHFGGRHDDDDDNDDDDDDDDNDGDDDNDDDNDNDDDDDNNDGDGDDDNDDDDDDGPPSTAVIPSVPVPSKLVSTHISINPQYGSRFATLSRSLPSISSNVGNRSTTLCNRS